MKLCTEILICFLFILTPAVSKEVAGVMLDEKIIIENNNLTLNGAGIRSKFVFDIYVGALYLLKTTNSTDAVLQSSGPKRVHMVFLYDEVGKDKLTSGWSDGFENNLTDAELSELKNKISAFNQLFETAQKGDIIDLDYIPGKGTHVYYNSKLRGVVKGEAFNRALLKIWLGEEPADESLKAGMLGRD